eukprot:TRINITY_DN49485_c0_g1_i1.p1 TRINITY_DN49485_c0_g1~~TRINITY_DN49485_c0_g1_i1.p1  ORF type:complete len:429 (+),score=55.02 TRINITY_DN49485_c0_g1_i1:34-1287(+)
MSQYRPLADSALDSASRAPDADVTSGSASVEAAGACRNWKLRSKIFAVGAACAVIGGLCVLSLRHVGGESVDSDAQRPLEDGKAAASLALLGGDRDEHGCIPSAGYVWCRSRDACVRPWEIGIKSEDQLFNICGASATALREKAEESDRCSACVPDANSLACRACRARLSTRAFCSACITEGLNDVACRNCPTAAQDLRLRGGSNAQESQLMEQSSTSACTVCESDENALPCRACKMHLSSDAFCSACSAEGLNDVGCRGCQAMSDRLGGDKDSHGCIGTAGYVWCEKKSSCIRTWEEGINVENFDSACGASSAKPPVLAGADRDSHGCIPSAGYVWCAQMQSCIRPWEHKIFKSNFESRCDASTAENSAQTTKLMQCNCPPSEAVYSCTVDEFRALKDGSTCPYYKHDIAAADSEK